MYDKIQESFEKLTAYCKSEEFKGYDPYDGLTSSLFNSLPIIKSSKIARLAWIQGFKRSPLNFRPLVGIKKDYNPKALGLFLSGYCALYKKNTSEEYLDNINFFINKIVELSSKGYSGACWGYNFDWEARPFVQPKFTPTVVVSSFVANGLLDAYELLKEQRILEIVRSTCEFILKDLNRTYSPDGNFIFSYSRFDNSVIYNASLLGSRLLARVYSITGEKMLLEEAAKSVGFCCESQKKDGSWTYGKLTYQQWIDSFHTGYNLECISDYMRFSGDYSYESILESGFNYYLNTFFTDKGIPKYYSNSIYPIDIHNPAQLVIVLRKLGKFQEYKILMDKVLDWTIDNMQSEKGFFYYQINRYYRSRIPYMRWSQAWMFYALSMYLSN